MKVLDLGAGYDPQRWFPGADIAENNLAEDEIPPSDERKFYIGMFGEEQLPVPDKTYDLVWYSYGWYTVSMHIRKKVAAEITRVTGDKATLVLRDYCSYTNREGRDVCLTAKQWKRIVETCFPEWTLDGFYTELSPDCSNIETYDDEFCVVAILKKGWG